MKKLTSLIIFLLCFKSFSQYKIDTTTVAFKRFEWKVNLKTNDTTLKSILTKYKSGIYKDKGVSKSNDNKFYNERVYQKKVNYNNKNDKNNHIVHYWSVGNVSRKLYYDNNRILDSTYSVIQKDSLITLKNIVQKKLSNEKIIERTYDDNSIDFYFYGLTGKLKKIKNIKNSDITEIKYFKKSRIKKNYYPLRIEDKYVKYKYDNKKRLIEIDKAPYKHLFKYGDFGIIKFDKIYTKLDKSAESIEYFYNRDGYLEKKISYFRYKIKEINLYTYKN